MAAATTKSCMCDKTKVHFILYSSCYKDYLLLYQINI